MLELVEFWRVAKCGEVDVAVRENPGDNCFGEFAGLRVVDGGVVCAAIDVVHISFSAIGLEPVVVEPRYLTCFCVAEFEESKFHMGHVGTGDSKLAFEVFDRDRAGDLRAVTVSGNSRRYFIRVS